ncbi:MAG: DUF4465 domain-containing protein, partial [Chitinophagales bacterium]
GFSIENAFLPNSYNQEWMSWSGWAISSMTDTTTPGFMNDLSSITGGGYEGSTTYATTFVVGESILKLEGAAAGGMVNGFYITNNTYTYLSMLNGDGFAKKFGGLLGDDPDYLLLTIKKYKDGELGMDSVNFYLADYRFEDNSQDYIVSDWQYLDLTSLGDVDSLSFGMTSTDNSTFGINTPAYFSMDNFETADVSVNIPQFEAATFKMSPNPSTDFVQIEGLTPFSSGESIEIRDLIGRIVLQKNVVSTNGVLKLNVESLASGLYFVRIGNEVGRLVKR